MQEEKQTKPGRGKGGGRGNRSRGSGRANDRRPNTKSGGRKQRPERTGSTDNAKDGNGAGNGRTSQPGQRSGTTRNRTKQGANPGTPNNGRRQPQPRTPKPRRGQQSEYDAQSQSMYATPDARPQPNGNFAWSAFQNSPDPKELPIPSFFKRSTSRNKNRTQSTNSAGRDMKFPLPPGQKGSKEAEVASSTEATNNGKEAAPTSQAEADKTASDHLKGLLGLSLK